MSSNVLNVDASQVGITELGTITKGAWEATKVADNYIASAATWNENKMQLQQETVLHCLHLIIYLLMLQEQLKLILIH